VYFPVLFCLSVYLYCVGGDVKFCSLTPFVSISQVIGCEDRLQNDLDCVMWNVKLNSNSSIDVAELNVYYTCY